MATAILALTLFTTVVDGAQDVVVVVKTAKAVHHHFLHPVYKHVLKPVARALGQS
jgi:hypothetical protein